MVKDTKSLSYELYLANFSIPKIASILNKSEKTIRNYKTKKWDEDKATKYLSKRSDDKEFIYNSFVEEMHLAIKDIRESELKPKEKASAYAAIGDSFLKMRKVAISEDPESYRRAIIKQTITLIVRELRDDKECVERIVKALESEEFIQELEGINVH